MKLCVATTWENRLIHELLCIESKKSNRENVKIYELFGALQTSILGSGREAVSLPKVSEKEARKHIALARSYGIKFNYLINCACMGNQEFSTEGYWKLINYLTWIRDLGVDIVTVSIPSLVEIVKEQFPELEVNISTIAHVKAVNQVEHFRKLGANRITLSYMINRDFNLLRKLSKVDNVELEILVNESCMFHCPFRAYHYNLVSHGSQGKMGMRFVQYPFFRCSLAKLMDPSELIKARWVRPEDIGRYEELGIKYIKLAGREKTTDWLIRCANAYASREYKGNLLDIIALVFPDKKDFCSVLGESLSSNIVQPPPVYVDNTKLQSFLAFFENEKIDCEADCGIQCNYCGQVARKVVEIDEMRAAKYMQLLLHTLGNIRNGRFIEYSELARENWNKSLDRR